MSTAIPSTYTQQFALPDGFPGVLKELTREILREQPTDIDAFCMQYFEKKLAEAGEDPNSDKLPGAFGNTEEDIDPAERLCYMDPSEVEELIHGLFKEQDTDNNRTLDRHEFRQVFSKLGKQLGLTTNDVRRILAEADSDENGEISYAEFIPVALSIIETIVAKYQLKKNEEKKEKAMVDAEHHIYHGLRQEELDEMLTEIFREADQDNSGYLDLDEFEKCLQDIRIGITRRELNVVMFEAYAKDGQINYEDFKPLCMKLLVELTAQEWMAPSQDEKDLENLIIELCQKVDEEQTGLLSHSTVQDCLLKADLGLTLLQICSIMSEAEEDEQSRIDYSKFAPRAAFMVHSCQHYRQRMIEKKEQMQTLHSSEEWGFVFGKDRDTLEHDLLTAFEEADSEGVGCLSREDIKKCIASVLDLDKKTMNALLALASKTETAMFRYQPVVDQSFRTLKGILELAIIYE